MSEQKQISTQANAPLSEWDIIRHQAKVLVESQFLPKAVDTWQKATAIIMYGKELGIGPMEAIQSIDVIQGKPTQKPQSMKAMVHRKLPGAIFRVIKSTDTECVIEAARPGDSVVAFSFTWEDAVRLQLTTKDNYKKQPNVMLQWRCIGKVARAVFPDCLSGVSHSPEELDAEVDEDCNVIDVQASQKTTPKEIDAKVQSAAEEVTKREATVLFQTKISELKAIGYKDDEICKQLKIKNYNDIILKDSKTIYAALEALQDATL